MDSRSRSLAIRPRGVPLKEVKEPPISIFPPDSSAIPHIVPLAPVPGFQVLSRVPSVFTRAILVRLVPLYVVNPPARIILPSPCISTSSALLTPLPGSKLVSSVPEVFRRLIPSRNSPTTIGLSFAFTAISQTWAPEGKAGVKVAVAPVPSLTAIIPLRVEPFQVVKSPPAYTLLNPNAIVYIVPLGPVPGLKDVFKLPLSSNLAILFRVVPL